jgi:uncharacterized protein YbjT (DUF2867 family)
MKHSNHIIAVIGATGQQGGAVARLLLNRGWRVRALTRDTRKPAAQTLAQMGAEIVPGDLDNPSELSTAFKDAYGVFSVQNYWLPNVGFDGEVRQGKDVANIAQETNVKHMVYSSVGAAHRGMGQQHFESKYLIEQHIKAIDIPYTILRPAAFMENTLWNREKILEGAYPSWGIAPEKTLQTVAVDDIAAFTTLALENPDQYLGKTIELAGDELTESQMAEKFTQAIGRPVKVEVPKMPENSFPDDEQEASFRFFSGEAYTADISALRRMNPDLLDFETWLHRTGWSSN